MKRVGFAPNEYTTDYAGSRNLWFFR